MSGIGDSLADLDKGVRKSVPGGWGTVAALGAGGAGLYYGLGASAAGGATAAGTGGGFGLTAASGGAPIAAGMGAGTGLIAPTAGTTFGALSAGAAPVAGEALTASAAAAMPGSAEAIAAAQKASTVAGASNPFSISPMQAMMASRMVGGRFGQQQQGGQASSVGLRQGQQINSADPIAALLAPKMKKKERISLL